MPRREQKEHGCTPSPSHRALRWWQAAQAARARPRLCPSLSIDPRIGSELEEGLARPEPARARASCSTFNNDSLPLSPLSSSSPFFLLPFRSARRPFLPHIHREREMALRCVLPRPAVSHSPRPAAGSSQLAPCSSLAPRLRTGASAELTPGRRGRRQSASEEQMADVRAPPVPSARAHDAHIASSVLFSVARGRGATRRDGRPRVLVATVAGSFASRDVATDPPSFSRGPRDPARPRGDPRPRRSTRTALLPFVGTGSALGQSALSPAPADRARPPRPHRRLSLPLSLSRSSLPLPPPPFLFPHLRVDSGSRLLTLVFVERSCCSRCGTGRCWSRWCRT